MTDPVKPATLGDILSSASRAERTARICVAGHLNDAFDALERELAAAVAKEDGGSLADMSQDRYVLAGKIEALRAEMAAHEHDFTFQALHPKEWSDLLASHQPREDHREIFNVETFPLAACQACLHKVNGQEVDGADQGVFLELWNDKLNEGQRGDLFEAAYSANTGRVSVPFSALASVTLQRTDAK